MIRIPVLETKQSGKTMRYIKSSLSVLFVLTLGLSVMSCTDLTENPYSEITRSNFNPTAKDIPNLVAPVYTPMRSFMSCCYSYIGMQDEAADMEIKPSRPNGWGGPYLPYHKHQWGPTHPYTGNYSTFFDGVNAANRVIYQIQSGKVPVEDPLKTRILSELKVARAFYYYLLMDNFGNVPIVTDFTRTKPPSQASREEVYNFVVSQLKNNISNLSEKANLKTYGRFNKWAGKMILAEAYLNAGVYLGDGDPSDGQNGKWSKVIKVTNDIINSGKYMLEPNYKTNFKRNTQTSSDEIIFAIPYDEVKGPGNTFHMMSLTPKIQQAFGMRATPWGGGAAQPQFAGTYDKDDKRLEDTWINGTLRGPQGDSLAYYTRNIPSISNTKFKHGWRIKKYQIYEGLAASSDVDMPFYRYAETLMMKAEALLRMGRASQAADIVTRVRQRAFDDPSEAKVTASELKQPSVMNWGYWKNGKVVEPGDGPKIKYGRFLDELGWEFAMEGHRRQDMIRFGAFTTKTWFNHRDENSKPYHRIFPIPQDALNANPKLKQNPGY